VQVLIYNALGFEQPTFGHVSLILAGDKSKLSKRCLLRHLARRALTFAPMQCAGNPGGREALPFPSVAMFIPGEGLET